MKGVILAAGKGTRMRPLTDDFPKCMLPVAGIPIIEWTVRLLKEDLHIKEILIIVGYAKHHIINYFGDGSKWDISIEYKEQDLDTNSGLGAALIIARDFVDDDFVVVLGDNLYKGPFHEIIRKHKSLESDATLHIEEVEDPGRYGVIVLHPDSEYRIKSLIEKPKNPPSNKVITGFYVLSTKIFEILDQTSPSKRGEIELTDALNTLAKNFSVNGIIIDGWRKDFGYPIDLLDAAKWLMNNGMSIIKSDIKGGVKINNPVYIGKNCSIENSTIGPYVSIGNKSIIKNAKVTHSVILDNAIIENEEIIDSIIGKKTRVEIH